MFSGLLGGGGSSMPSSSSQAQVGATSSEAFGGNISSGGLTIGGLQTSPSSMVILGLIAVGIVGTLIIVFALVKK